MQSWWRRYLACEMTQAGMPVPPKSQRILSKLTRSLWYYRSTTIFLTEEKFPAFIR